MGIQRKGEKMKFKAELYYHDKKIAEGPFEEKPFGSGIPGPEGMLGIRNTAFHVKWFKEEKVKK